MTVTPHRLMRTAPSPATGVRTLGALRPDKKRRIARETLEIYARIAARRSEVSSNRP